MFTNLLKPFIRFFCIYKIIGSQDSLFFARADTRNKREEMGSNPERSDPLNLSYHRRQIPIRHSNRHRL